MCQNRGCSQTKITGIILMIRIQIDLQMDQDDPTYKEVEQHLYEILLFFSPGLLDCSGRPGCDYC